MWHFFIMNHLEVIMKTSCLKTVTSYQMNECIVSNTLIFDRFRHAILYEC